MAARGSVVESLSSAWGCVRSPIAARYSRMCRSALDDLSGPEPKDDDWMTSEVQRQEATAAVVMAEAFSERKEVTLMKTKTAKKRRHMCAVQGCGTRVRYKCVFQKEVGEETLKSHPHISRLAKIVAEECKGLPFALITLGRAMAGEKDPSNWDKVIQDLSKFPAEISGMEDELFHRLKVSYDRLSDNVIKSCFTYCSLFSEDWEVSNENLIEYWIGEGFLSEVHDIHEAHNQGLKEAQEIPILKVAEKMSLWDENVKKFPKTLDIKIEGEGEGTQRDATLQNYNAARGNYFRALHGFWQQPGFDLLHIDWAASVFADWGCAALFPCTCAGSQSIYFHGADTAGKVAASFSFLAGIGFCGLPLLSGFFT
ncbi:Disease resistance protein RPS5 [Vitis vinifera]|uniref:Disease resistance protein RPS5 n=1 Tax=Vitis vinifera TaxID=29760 RepID=A0A438DF59_VITVI|nr:Disease resistance protein RPS5 [Vitis vinifera]